MKLNFNEEIAPILPNSPGVYLMKSDKDEIIYVGKAKNLKRRVTSYFVGAKTGKTALLVKQIANIEFIVVSHESEALLLENNLIKKHNPKYNIDLKDGKTYPVLRITNEKFPQIFKTRQIVQDGSQYFGPFTDVRMLDTYIKLIKKLFPIRRCRGSLKRKHPCLYYHLGQCAGPCTNEVTALAYGKIINKIKDLLSGDNQTLIKKLQREMEKAATSLQFEKAASIRDAIRSLETIAASQDIVDFNPEIRDFISYIIKNEEAVFSVFQMREGHISGRDLIHISPFIDKDAAIEQFIIQYYERYHTPASKIYINKENLDSLQEYLRHQHNSEITFYKPESPREFSIIRMGEENCRHELLRITKKNSMHPGVEELYELFKLPHRPTTIEGFDTSHLHGKYTVTSLITFVNGQPNPSGYRSFNIKSLNGKIDDYGAVREAVARRYTRLLNEKKPLPKLILIDGGAGQVSAAKEILDALGLKIPLLGLAEKEEDIYTAAGEGPIKLPMGSDALTLLQAVRDETHRFATQKSFRKRDNDLHFALLEQAEGIGPKRAIKLMKKFNTIENILNQTAKTISLECQIPLATAKELLKTLTIAKK